MGESDWSSLDGGLYLPLSLSVLRPRLYWPVQAAVFLCGGFTADDVKLTGWILLL